MVKKTRMRTGTMGTLRIFHSVLYASTMPSSSSSGASLSGVGSRDLFLSFMKTAMQVVVTRNTIPQNRVNWARLR